MREGYPYVLEIPTRWADNDIYGHVNNATYYAYFDTAVNRHLTDHGLLQPAESSVVGVVVETMCRFHRSLAFPDTIEAGVRVTKIGNSSVTYELALFRQGDPEPAATGHFVHVYVDRGTRRPVAIPAAVRAELEKLRVR
ncbi:MAG TPA: thioesterase family protein [Myxococcales bacterium]|nr:thioesterase family protein [Myxococcales bacterium]